MKEKRQILVRVEPAHALDLATFDFLCSQENRSVVAQIRHLMKQWIEEKTSNDIVYRIIDENKKLKNEIAQLKQQ